MKSLTNLVSTLVVTVSLISCGGQKPMVDDVKVSPYQQDGDLFVSLSADLSIGNVQMPIVTVPITLKSGKQIGNLTMQTTIDGKNQILVDLNVSETANINLEQARLPNGLVIPLIGDNQVLEIPVGNNISVYLSLGADHAALGFAIPIKSFDSLGRSTGTAALMPWFNKDEVVGAAGIYTSKTAGQNGFALVADLSNVLSLSQKSSLISQNFSIEQEQSSLEYESASASSRQERKINRGLLKMHRSRTQLELN